MEQATSAVIARRLGQAAGRRRYAVRPRAAVLAETVDRALLAAVLAAVVAVPLVFSLEFDDAFALPKTVVERAIAVACFGLLAARFFVSASGWRAGSGILPRDLVGASLAVYLGLNIVAFVVAIDPSQALSGERYQHQGLLAVVSYLILFQAARVTMATDERRRLLFSAITITASLVAAYAFVQRAGLDPIWPSLLKNRVFSTIGQANALAAYLVLAIPPAGALMSTGRPVARLAGGLAVILEVVALAFTLSRGGYLGAVVALSAVVLFGWPGWGMARRRTAAGVVLVAVAIAVLVAVPMGLGGVRAVVQRAASTADLGEGSIRNHLDLWAVGLRVAADHPWLGTGQDTYVLLFDRYRDVVLSPERAALMARFRPESPHNVYIATAAGAGLPALIAYVAIVVACIRLAVRAAGSAARSLPDVALVAIAAAAAGHSATDAFMTAEVTGSMIFWVLLGAGAAERPADAAGLAVRAGRGES